MSEIKEYRPINEDERIEIDQLAAKGLVLIGLQESAESSAILDGIKNYLNNFESSDDEEITDRAYELGSLLGNTIQKHYGWNWFCVEENTDDSFHCVASNKERACCACHEYIYSILTKQHSNNVKLLFNMIKCTAPQKLDTFGVFFMKYNYEIRLKAVKLVLEGGLSVREAGCHLGCGRSQVHLWVTLFERHGLTGLKLRHGSYSAEFKLSVLKHMHQNHLSLLETAVHFGIPGPFVIRQWERLYQNQGAEGLRRKPQRRRPAMSKSKTKKVKLKTTPHEELLKELEYLRAENAYLKKLQALVEERIVRESGKEPKPSKD